MAHALQYPGSILRDADYTSHAPYVMGAYTVLGRIATGGMAELLLALGPGPGGVGPVAIKQIRPELASREAFVHMFRTEALLAAGMHHPNVVRVHDVGEHDGRAFMVMEYVAGTNARALSRALRARRRMPLAAALTIVRDAARGLDYAHDACDDAGRPLDLVHRDVSPANILVATAGRVKVTDFGVARVGRTHLGDRLMHGTVPYVSPEQVLGNPVDRRADVYALGIVLYELSTGQRAFPGPDPLLRIGRGALHPPSLVCQGYPGVLDHVVRKAISLQPGDRHATAAALADDLERVARRLQLRLGPATLVDMLDDLPDDDLDDPGDDDATIPGRSRGSDRDRSLAS